MSTKKIILKTARKRKGTVSRTAIRKAVQVVFGTSKTVRPARTTKATAGKVGTGALQAK